MSEPEQLKRILDALLQKVRLDQNVPTNVFSELVMMKSKLEGALTQLEKAKQIDVTQIKSKFEDAQRLQLMLEEIKRSEGKYPSYIDDFIQSIANTPYTMPKTLYEPQGAQQISIDVGGEIKTERAELALALLFPGSTTYRYGMFPVKVSLGRWYQSGRARLSSIHVLSSEPEFQLTVGQRTYDVYRPLLLRAFRLRRHWAICTSCLSLLDEDETCAHRSIQPRVKLPSGYPILRKLELSREAATSKDLQKPMSLIIPRVTYLRQLRVGLAVMGFERTASVRGASRTIMVNYDPPIGIRLMTSGLSFQTRIPEEFLKETLQSNLMLRRDAMIQLLANRLADIMSEIGLPSYHHELILSSVVSILHLNELTNEQDVMQRLRDDDFVDQVMTAIHNELDFYESAGPDAASVQNMLRMMQSFDITEDRLISKLRETILHSLAHVLLLSAAVTSGSQLDDLDYLVKEDNGEIVIFDSVSGGNGSSETAFEFLSETGTFSVEEYLQSEEREETYKPRNLDETAFEFLLPCLNSVSDKVFLFSKVEPIENEIKRKMGELKDKETTHQNAIRRIREYGTTAIFPLSIGYHSMDYSKEHQEADRFKEMATICIHGCPECISIGRKCQHGSFHEKYNISKFALDELLNFVLRHVTLTQPFPDQALKTLGEYGFTILKGSCVDEHTCEELVRNMNALILQIVGQEAGNGYVKFSGHWVNMNLASGEIDYYYLLKVI